MRNSNANGKWSDSLIPRAFPPGHFRRQVLPAVIVDAVIVVASYYFAIFVRTTEMAFAQPEAFIGGAVIVTLAGFYWVGVYHRLWPYTGSIGVTVILQGTIVSTAIMLVVDLLVQPRQVPLSSVLLGNLLILIGAVAVRYRTRFLSGIFWRWRAILFRETPKEHIPERVLIVGAGLSGRDLARALSEQRQAGKLVLVGFVDDDPKKQALYLEDRPILGTTADIPGLVEDYDIDMIAVAIHNISGPDFRRILEACESTPARIKVLPDFIRSIRTAYNKELLRPVHPQDLIGRSSIERHEDVDLSPVQNKIVLVTGAAGSIGSELSRQMIGQDPTTLILLDSNESALHDMAIDLKYHYPDLHLEQALVDIIDRESLNQVFAEYHPQIVFHAAAYKHVPLLEKHPDAAVKVNIGGTRNLVELSREHKVERFVLVSTDKAVNPSSVMGASKRVCEMIVRAMAAETQETLFAIVRFGNVLASRGSVVPTFTRQIDRGGPVTVTHREMTRYFMSIPEAANLIIHAACLTDGNDTYLLRMGEVVKIVELAERMIRLRGMRPYIDIEIKFTGTRPGEKLHEELMDTDTEVSHKTIHPGIMRLAVATDYYNQDEFLHWVDCVLRDGLNDQPALEQLRYGLMQPEVNQN